MVNIFVLEVLLMKIDWGSLIIIIGKVKLRNMEFIVRSIFVSCEDFFINVFVFFELVVKEIFEFLNEIVFFLDFVIVFKSKIL